jgi:hypothetical protein
VHHIDLEHVGVGHGRDQGPVRDLNHSTVRSKPSAAFTGGA